MLEKNYRYFAEKSLSVFEMLKGGPFKHTNTYFHKMFSNCFSPFITNAFGTNSGFFSQKFALNKKEINWLRQGLKIAAFQQSFSQC